jgi:enamine deaminase RidA (YjgF/YER057c/UK114 family)
VIERWPINGRGRSRTVAYRGDGGLVWTVANATDSTGSFDVQVSQSLQMLEAHLQEAGSARTHLLSLQVILTDIANRDAFDQQWQAWVGPDPEHWPQRACFQSGLAPGLQVELIVVAAPVSVAQTLGPGANAGPHRQWGDESTRPPAGTD